MDDVPPYKKAKIESSSIEVEASNKATIGPSIVELEASNSQLSNHQNGELSVNGSASSEAGLSRNGPTHDVESPSSNNSNSQDSRSSVGTGSTAGLSGGGSPSGLPGSSSPSNNQDEEDDNVSVLSGISDMSGKGWKPDMKGELSWLSRARAKGVDPRDIIRDLMQGGEADMLSSMDDNTIWMILYKMFAQPPKRQKLKDFNTLEDLAKHIKQAKKILVLTGAGVSVSCGIPDFRSKDGVYARLAVDFPDLPDPQAMFDIQYFRKDPRPFFKFAKEIYPGQFTPSPCHRFIQCLEREGKLLRNYTQNIDTLEQVAGISRVVQCHGSFATASCTVCTGKQDAETIRGDIMEQKIPLCPKCPSPDLQEILERLHKQQEERKEREKRTMEEIKKMFLNPSGVESVKDQGDKQNKQDSVTKGGDNDEQSIDKNSTQDPGSGSSPTCQPSTSKQADAESTSSSNTVPPHSNTNPTSNTVHPPSICNPTTSPPSNSLLSKPESVSQFSNVPIMKPDIVFFGEGLSDQFHKTISQDKDEVDLLIVIGSSLKVRPVALIPSSIPKHVPQVLINRERLSHLTFDVELLGDCDVVINQLCHMLEGDWSPGIHKPVLEQTHELPAQADDSAHADDSANADIDDSNVDQGAKDPTVSEAGDSAEDAIQLNKSSNNPTAKGTDINDTTDKKDVSGKNDTTAANAESSNVGSSNVRTGTVDDPITSTQEDGFIDEDEDDEEESGDWKPRSLAENLPSHQFLHIPPHRYVFSGAEVYAEDFSDDDDGIESDSDLDNDQQEGELDTSNEETLNQSTQSDNQDIASSSPATGSSTQAPGSSSYAPGSISKAPGSSTQAPGSSSQASGSSTMAPGSSIQAPSSGTKAPGSRT